MPYKVSVVADSVNPSGCRITTFSLRYPRVILAEMNTHGILARSSSSSRAVPVEKVIDEVIQDPYIPPRWGLRGKGMQDHGEMTPEAQGRALNAYLRGRDWAVETARDLIRTRASKQIVNRVLEPYAWVSTVVTGTEWNNFFDLRAHDDADPAFQTLADMMLAAYAASEPEAVKVGFWHLPFVKAEERAYFSTTELLKLSSARVARTSYANHEGKVDPDADLALVDEKLLPSRHMSPFDHPAVAYGSSAWVGRFQGWCAYRKTLRGEAGRDRPLPIHRIRSAA